MAPCRRWMLLWRQMRMELIWLAFTFCRRMWWPPPAMSNHRGTPRPSSCRPRALVLVVVVGDVVVEAPRPVEPHGSWRGEAVGGRVSCSASPVIDPVYCLCPAAPSLRGGGMAGAPAGDNPLAAARAAAAAAVAPPDSLSHATRRLHAAVKKAKVRGRRLPL